MIAVEFVLTPNDIKVFARRQTGKAPVKQGNGSTGSPTFAFEGDDPIDFEDADSTLHFFFPKDYAWAVNDSATGFAGRTSVHRYFCSDRGKDYVLIGVPWNWINQAPAGTLIKEYIYRQGNARGASIHECPQTRKFVCGHFF